MSTGTTAASQSLVERRAEAARLYREGNTLAAIAEVLGVDKGTISRDLATLRGQLLARATEDYRARVAEELVKLDALEVENALAWEKSKGAHAKRSVKRNREGDVVETTDTTELLLGDPRYLANIQKCIDRRCQLLGLDSPRQLNVTGMEATAKVYIGIDIEQLV